MKARNSNLLEQRRSSSKSSRLKFKMKHCNSEVNFNKNNDEELIQEIKQQAHKLHHNPNVMNFLEIYEDFIAENRF